MTRVTYRSYYDRFLVIVEGHSGYARCGEDVVCAGISTLVYTLVNTMLDEESSGNIRLKRNIIRDGYVCLEIELFEFSGNRIKGIIDAFMNGIMMLQESYPKNIFVE